MRTKGATTTPPNGLFSGYENGMFIYSEDGNQYQLGRLIILKDDQYHLQWHDTEWVANGRVALFLALVFLILLWTNMQWRDISKTRLQELMLTRLTSGEILAGYSALPMLMIFSFFGVLAIIELLRLTVFAHYASPGSYFMMTGMIISTDNLETSAYPDLLCRLTLLFGLLGWMIASLGAIIYCSLRFPSLPNIATVFTISITALVIASWVVMLLYDPQPLKLVVINSWIHWYRYLGVHPLPLLLFWPITYWQWHRLRKAFPKLITQEHARKPIGKHTK